MRGLLLADQIITSWGDLFKDGSGPLDGTAYESWLKPLMGVMSTVLWVVMALVGAAGGIYAIYVGIKMARADSAEQRDENKKRMINIIVAIVVSIVLIVFFNLFLPMILGAVMTQGADYGQNNNPAESQPGSSSIGTIVTAAKVLLRLPL